MFCAKYSGHSDMPSPSIPYKNDLIVVIEVRGNKSALRSMKMKFRLRIAAYRSDLVLQSSIKAIKSMNRGIKMRLTNMAANEEM